MGARIISYDVEQRIRKAKENHGEDVFVKSGRKGGLNNKSNTSEKGRMAAEKRWAKHRAEKAKQEKGDAS
jgi:hypothetical protein